MSWQDLRNIATDSVFATWFGWSLIVALTVFPVTSMVTTCSEQSVMESIEMAKLDALHGDRETKRIETVKWMISRGVNPLVARCVVYNDPYTQCSNSIARLGDEDRAVIAELIQNPGEFERTEQPELEVPVTDAPVTDPREYIKGLDFGMRSPVK